MLQRENRLPDLAPERRLIAAKPFENAVIEVGETKKTARKLASTRIAPGLEDFDNLAHFSGERRIGCGACFALVLEQAGPSPSDNPTANQALGKRNLARQMLSLFLTGDVGLSGRSASTQSPAQILVL